jgi:hypothetical protein
MDYILETFIDENSSFRPYMWAESSSSDPRTKNGPEAFHRDFNIVNFIQVIQIVLI